MGDIVNLNQFRKRRERASKALKGAAKHVRAGRSKAERQVTQAEATRSEAALEGKRIEREPNEPPGGGGSRPESD